MRFAITHPMLSHPYHPDLVTGAGVAALARAAEAAGFDGYGFTDHPAPPQSWLDVGGHDALDPFAALGFVAAATTSIRLIPNLVVLAYRNPFVVAKAAATLDSLSGGRFTLAVGAGYLEAEYAALGVDHGERGPLIDEALEVLRAVWTSDEVSFEGRHFRAEAITAHPRPVTAPHPPIWIGGNSAAARRRVARWGQGWAPFPASGAMAAAVETSPLDGLDAFADAVADLRRRLEAEGRDPATVDICFSTRAGGNPAKDTFDADANLEALAALAELGVTWVQVGIPGDSVARAIETMERYRELVIDRSR
jgi:probable F420-dependent oxidoreductase